MRPTSFRNFVRILLSSGILAGGLLLAGCSEDGPVPVCENCEIWDQVSAGLARFPDPHPDRSGFYVFSTISKTPGADDANRESDEDVWLMYDARDPAGPVANRMWQLTADEMGQIGDNLSPRWSPSGTRVLFTHTREDGLFEIWRLDVTLPVDPSDPGAVPVLGAPERLATNARDPEWVTDTEIVFTRGSKLYRLDLTTRGGSSEEQLTFNPPIYASSEAFVDRHPDVALDGGAAFSTLGRLPVGTVFIEAFEDVNRTGALVETDAFLLLQPPGAVGTYPLFEGADTLRTPATLRSLPTSEESGANLFTIGVRIDDRFLSDSTRVTYCDTTLTRVIELLPGDVDSLRFVFEPARGSLRVQTQRPLTDVFWERQDGAVSIDDLPGSSLLANAGDFRVWDCLLSWRINGQGVPIPDNLEPYIVTGTSDGMVDQDTVFVSPDELAEVVLFDTEPAPETVRARRAETFSGRSEPPAMKGGSPLAGLRAEGDLGTVWRVDLSGPAPPDLREIAGSIGVVQNPTVTEDLGSGVRYLAYVSDETGRWQLYVQRLENWSRSGAAAQIPTPGSLDNLSCDRDVFYPRFLPETTASEVHLICSLGDCPDNGFEDLGFDEDPWSLGELRLWRVVYAPN